MYNLKQSSAKNNRWLLWSLSIVVMMLIENIVNLGIDKKDYYVSVNKDLSYGT